MKVISTNNFKWLVLSDESHLTRIINTDKIRKIDVFKNKHTDEVKPDMSTIWYVDDTYDVLDIPLYELAQGLGINIFS